MNACDRYALVHGLTDGFEPSLDPDLALGLQARHNLTAFVETGIWHGGTTQWALDHFSRVFACDLDPVWVTHARARFEEYPHLQLDCADSRAFLRTILPLLGTPAFIYLDAHYIADKHSAGNPDDCPLLGELDAIRQSSVPHVAVIDDARLIVGRDPDYLLWPTFDEVCAALPEWTVTHEGRALVAIPHA